MTGFQKIEKAMNDARMQYTDTEYTVNVIGADRYKSVEYTSIACAIYANNPHKRIMFVYLGKWTTSPKYVIKVIDEKGECKYEMNTSDDVITAVTMLIRSATL